MSIHETNTADITSQENHSIFLPGEQYHDAIVRTPFDERDYEHQTVITEGAKRDAKYWKPKSKLEGEFLADLCQHLVGTKDGRAVVLADVVSGRRLNNAVKAVTHLGLDIDNGLAGAEIDTNLKALGCAAVRYTTHSHLTTRTELKKERVHKFANGRIDSDVMRRLLVEQKEWVQSIAETVEYAGDDHTPGGIVCIVEHAPMPKHRIVVPLKEPFVIADVARTQTEAIRKWGRVVEAFAGLLGVPFDKSCIDPARLFFYPRHAKGGGYEISLFGGVLFDWRTLTLENSFDQLAAKTGTSQNKSTTPEGRALGSWYVKRGHGFQAADVFREFAADRIRNDKGDKLEIECPFDDCHSNAGDARDSACFVANAGSGSECYLIKCHHASCQDKTSNDHLGKSLKDGFLPHSVLEAEEFNALLEDGDVARAHLTGGAVKEQITALGAEPDTAKLHDILAAIKLVEAASKRDALFDIARDSVKGERKKTVDRVRKEARDHWKAQPQNSNDAAGSASDDIAKELSKSLGRDFVLPPPIMGDFFLEHVDGTAWLFRRGKPNERLCTPFVLRGGVTYADRGAERALRIDVLKRDGSWVAVDIHAADLGTVAAVAVVGKIMGSGVAATRSGKAFIADYLSECQPREMVVYDRPGFRGKGFICPTGQVLLTSDPIELAPEKRLKCDATSGDIEGWREGAYGIFGLDVEKAYHFQACILLGFAGPLVNLAGDETACYSLEGEPGTGKSTGQMLAAGSYCNPALAGGEGLFVLAKGTANSHEAAIERGQGTLTALDEFGHLPAKDQQEIVFMAQAGVGKRRLNANAEERKTRGWQGGVLIVSAETGFAQRLRLEGVRQAGGLTARMIPISTDNIAGRLAPHEVAHVAKALASYGWSGPQFVLALQACGYVKRRSGIKAKIAKLVEQLSGTTGSADVNRRRAARHVAYIWAAGLIAKTVGLVPRDFDMKRLAEKLWQDALESESGPTDPNERALARLVDEITARKDADIVPLSVLKDDKRFRKEAWGFYDDLAGSTGGYYIIRETKFDDLSGGFVTGRAFRKFLDDRGYLVKRKGTDSRTWNGYPGLGKDAQYVVLHMNKIDSPTNLPDAFNPKKGKTPQGRKAGKAKKSVTKSN